MNNSPFSFLTTFRAFGKPYLLLETCCRWRCQFFPHNLFHICFIFRQSLWIPFEFSVAQIFPGSSRDAKIFLPFSIRTLSVAPCSLLHLFQATQGFGQWSQDSCNHPSSWQKFCHTLRYHLLQMDFSWGQEKEASFKADCHYRGQLSPLTMLSFCFAKWSQWKIFLRFVKFYLKSHSRP